MVLPNNNFSYFKVPLLLQKKEEKETGVKDFLHRILFNIYEVKKDITIEF